MAALGKQLCPQPWRAYSLTFTRYSWISHMSTLRALLTMDLQSRMEIPPPDLRCLLAATLGHSTPHSQLRSTILVHQKSPLLVATLHRSPSTCVLPPFSLPLTKCWITHWTTGDPWKASCFLLASGRHTLRRCCDAMDWAIVVCWALF